MLQNAGFYSAANSSFGNVGHVAPEEVIIQLTLSKCMLILMYGLEACLRNKADNSSLRWSLSYIDSSWKCFKTNNVEIVRTCQEQFRFRLSRDQVALRSKKLESGEFVRL